MKESIIRELDAIINNLSLIIKEIKTWNGKIDTEILDRIDSINKLSVEV